jgi:hypothetical protein
LPAQENQAIPLLRPLPIVGGLLYHRRRNPAAAKLAP